MSLRSKSLLPVALLSVSAAMIVSASTDYGPAVWRPACAGKWYTSGYGHKFYVIHDMEGYYLTGIAWLQRCDVSGSVHYCVNGKKDNSTDAAEGEVSQLVRDSYYAWHAKCWNQHSMGTEHEGFVSNPAWFTDAMYRASATLTASKATKYGFAKDRNHIVGHDAKKSSAWCTYAEANLGIDAHCNTHVDPGAYWDWTKFMSYVNPAPAVDIIVDNAAAGFSCSANWSTGTSATDKYGSNYRYRSTAAVSDSATFTTTLPSAGTYKVYTYYPQGANRCTTTPFICSSSSGDKTVNINQTINGGKWVLLGTWSMNSGAATCKVSCWQAEGAVVLADAVRWQKQ